MLKRTILACASLAVILSAVACGGKYSAPTSPSTTPPAGNTTSNAVTIDIRSITGAQSFAPNPAAVNQGQMVAWHNSDGQTHRIVANDGSFDTGNIAPGATSNGVSMPRGTNYHCSLHTTMVGAIGVAAQPPPECIGPYCS
jgi:plastocyanin